MREIMIERGGERKKEKETDIEGARGRESKNERD